LSRDDEDEGKCSQEELYKEIKKLNSKGDVPTRELITFYKGTMGSLLTSHKFQLKIEKEKSPDKEFYKKICLLLVRLIPEIALEEEEKELETSLDANVENPIETIESLRKLADFLRKKREYDRALPLYEAIVDKKRKLAEGYIREREYDRALPLYIECLDIHKNVFGFSADHPDTHKLYKDISNLSEKEQKELENSLEASRRNLGEDHPDTIASLNNLAEFFERKYDYDRALPLLEELLPKRKRALGEDNPETLKSLNNLANLFYSRGEYDRAVPLYEELLAKQKRLLGEDDPNTLASFNKYIQLRETLRKKVEEQQQKEGTGASLGGRSKNKRNHKNKSFRSTRRRRYSRARGGKKIAASSSKTIKRRRKNAR
jgi:tetratricopeptide (TPR) repeat protein